MNTADLRELPKPPRPGDVGICAACGMVMIYMQNGQVRKPTRIEGVLIGQNDEIMRIRQSILDRL